MDLHTKVLGNTVEHWLQAIALSVGLWVAFWILKKITAFYLGKIAEKEQNPLYQTFSELFLRTKPFFLFAVSVFVALRPLTFSPKVEGAVDKICFLALVIQVGLWGGAFLRLWVEPYLNRTIGISTGSEGSTIAVVSFSIRLVFFSLLVIWGLDNLGVNVSTLIAGLGVGGIAVALATQNILGDLFASLSITLDKPFQIGDTITVDSFTGKIEKIGLKTTRMRSSTGEQLIFSNADLLKSRIRNYKRMQERRVLLRLGVTYDTPSTTLKNIPLLLRKAIEGRPRTRFERAHFMNFGPSSLDFEVIFWIEDPDYNLYMDTQQNVLLAINDAFIAEKIDFAFPTQTLLVTETSKPSTASPDPSGS